MEGKREIIIYFLCDRKKREERETDSDVDGISIRILAREKEGREVESS